MYTAACGAVPELDRWWFSLHSCLVSILTVEEFEALRPFKTIEPQASAVASKRCSMAKRSGKSGVRCENETDFVLVTVFVDPTSGKATNVRVRQVCAGCMYVNVSRTLTTLTDPDFYEGHEDAQGNSDPDVVYLVGERLDMFQRHLSLVTETLKRKRPETYTRLTELIQSGDSTPDW